MTPELYKYWYEGGKVETRFKSDKISKWEVLPQKENLTSWYMNDMLEYRKAHMPHKHAEFIKAWADGAAIEVCAAGRWTEVPNPVWQEDLQYRIKKE